MRITDLLRTIELFKELPSDELEQLSRYIHDRRLQPGEVLYGETQQGVGMLVLVDGSIELKLPDVDGGGSRRLTPGEAIGEVELISGDPAAYAATAIVESRVLELHKDDFDAFVAGRPHVMRSILGAVSRRAINANRRLLTEQSNGTDMAPSGRVYAVFSPRGGAGKTLVAMRLANRLSELIPRPVALLDLDLLFNDAAFQLDVSPARTLGSIADEDLQKLDARTLSSFLVEYGGSLRVLVGAATPEDGERVTSAHVRATLVALKRQFPATVIDCGGGLSEPVLTALEASDQIIFVCTPELTTLRDVRECRRLFAQALRIERTRITYMLNHPIPTRGLTRRQFEDSLDQPMLIEVPYAGEGASKPAFARAIDQLAGELQRVGAAA